MSEECDFNIMDAVEYYQCVNNKLYEKLEEINKIAEELEQWTIFKPSLELIDKIKELSK